MGFYNVAFDPGINQCINTYIKKNIPNNNDNCDLYPSYAPYHHTPSELSETLSELSETLSVRLSVLTLFPTTRLCVKLTHLSSRTNYRLTRTKSLFQQSPG